MYLRSDELPGPAAAGYVEIDGTWRTNVFDLPVRGSGDGGAYSTVADPRSLWQAFFAGEIVSAGWVEGMVHVRSETAPGQPYGLGFWLHPSTEAVMLEGNDAGVSLHSAHDRRSDVTHTVISNTTDGAWPVARLLSEHLAR